MAAPAAPGASSGAPSAGAVVQLPQVLADPAVLEGDGNDDHPMRKVTRQVAFDPDGWNPERAGKVGELFDSLAPEWHERMRPGRMDSLVDALDRGGIERWGRAVELGSGTGFATPYLVERFDAVVAVDLSLEMLRRAVRVAPRVQADAARLPLAAGGCDALVLVNMLLFPAEVERVVAPGGVVLWINSLAERTPIHLSADDVVAALPGRWAGVASRAGGGSWCVLRRRP